MKDYQKILKQSFVQWAFKERKKISPEEIGKAAGEERYSGPERLFLEPGKREAVNKSLKALEEEGLVHLIKQKDGTVTYYSAKLTEEDREHLSVLFKQYGILGKEEAAAWAKGKLEKLLPELQSEQIKGFTQKTLTKLEKGTANTPFQAGKQEEIEKKNRDILDAFRGADAVVQNGQAGRQIYIRDLSKKIFNYSKRFAEIENQIISILKESAPQEITEESEGKKEQKNQPFYYWYGVTKNPFSEMIAGNLVIETTNGTIDTCGLPYSFWTDREAEYQHIYVKNRTLLTIENLTTYHDFRETNTAKCFTGGFASPFLKHILKKIAEDNPALEIRHWGDMDGNGFRIFDDLKAHASDRFCPYRMDLDTFCTYIDKATAFEGKDQERIAGFVSHEYFGPAASYMLEHRLKLEQESWYADSETRKDPKIS